MTAEPESFIQMLQHITWPGAFAVAFIAISVAAIVAAMCWATTKL